MFRAREGARTMDTQTVVIYVASGILFLAVLMWLISRAVKSGKKAPLPTTNPYDTINTPPEDDSTKNPR